MPPKSGCRMVGRNQPSRSVLSGIASPQPLSEKSLVKNCVKIGRRAGLQSRKAVRPIRRKVEIEVKIEEGRISFRKWMTITIIVKMARKTAVIISARPLKAKKRPARAADLYLVEGESSLSKLRKSINA